MHFDPDETTLIRLATLAQLCQSGTWQLELPHSRPYHILIWMTRGQGVALLDGQRRGIGSHNAIFVPAGELMSIAAGRQCFGQVLIIPPGVGPQMPESFLHFRIRDAVAQNELTAILEALGREQNAARPYYQNAMQAHVDLVAVWLRRQLADLGPEAPRETASARLSRAYCGQIAAAFSSGKSMADHASMLGVTPTHLTRVCKAETGLTAAAILTRLTLHAALTLLTGTQASASDISKHLGFGSAAYFTRFLQQHTGAPPSKLRNASAPISLG